MCLGKGSTRRLTSYGYTLLKDNNDIAMDLFSAALRGNPNSFEALMGLVFAYLARIDQMQDEKTVAIGFYVLTKKSSGRRWMLEDAYMDAANKHIAYLDRAMENMPPDFADELKRFRRCNAENSYVLVESMTKKKEHK